ncbi:MAG: hypothetical protein LBT52_07065, partial [Clostridiales Family XIII bacterium]|nr:hypothetical protein [Clostridiales Family XIII bacterium]
GPAANTIAGAPSIANATVTDKNIATSFFIISPIPPFRNGTESARKTHLQSDYSRFHTPVPRMKNRTPRLNFQTKLYHLFRHSWYSFSMCDITFSCLCVYYELAKIRAVWWRHPQSWERFGYDATNLRHSGLAFFPRQ